METTGHFGGAAISIIDRICKVASTIRDKDYGTFRHYWMGRLSVALQSYTAGGFLRIAYDVKTRGLRRAARWAPFEDDDEEEGGLVQVVGEAL